MDAILEILKNETVWEVLLAGVGLILGRWFGVKQGKAKAERAIQGAGAELVKWMPVAEAAANNTKTGVDDDIVALLKKIQVVLEKNKSVALDEDTKVAARELASRIK